MEFSAQSIAEYLNGTVEGDPGITVSSFSKIEEGKKGTLSFLSNPQYTKYLYKTQASIVLINKDFKLEGPVPCTLIRVDNAYQSLAKLLDLYQKSKPVKQGVDQMASVKDDAVFDESVYIGAFTCIENNVKLGKNVKIYPNCYIGENVSIGDDCILYPGVKVYENCKIGNSCIIHAGAVIGADGFGFAPSSENDYKKIPQIGNAIIEDHVEIGANTTIDRATIGSTLIRKGVKLDNLIQVAHNVEIGENTVIAAQVGIAGSTKIGRDVMIGGQAGISGHASVANKVKIAAQAGISSSIKKEGEIVIGAPAINYKIFRRSSAVFKNLPELSADVYQLQKKIGELTEELKKLK